MWNTLEPEIVARLPRPADANQAASEAGGTTLANDVVKWKTTIDKLLEIRLLEDDFDGQGSLAPPDGLVDSAMILAIMLRQLGARAPDWTIATLNESVLLQWDWPSGASLEVEVLQPNLAEVFVHEPGKTGESFTIHGTADSLAAISAVR